MSKLSTGGILGVPIEQADMLYKIFGGENLVLYLCSMEQTLHIKDPGFWKKFFENRDYTGRYMITSYRTGVSYAIEPIGKSHSAWGDINPVTKKVEGSYGLKYRGSIDKEDTMITEEAGFKNIVTLDPGHSPQGYIEWKDAQYPTKSRS